MLQGYGPVGPPPPPVSSVRTKRSRKLLPAGPPLLYLERKLDDHVLVAGDRHVLVCRLPGRGRNVLYRHPAILEVAVVGVPTRSGARR